MAHLKTFVCFDLVSEDGSWNRKSLRRRRRKKDPTFVRHANDVKCKKQSSSPSV